MEHYPWSRWLTCTCHGHMAMFHRLPEGGSSLLILHTKVRWHGRLVQVTGCHTYVVVRVDTWDVFYDIRCNPTASWELQEPSTSWFVSQQATRMQFVFDSSSQPSISPGLMVPRTLARHSCMRKRVSCKVFGKIDRFWLLFRHFFMFHPWYSESLECWSSISGCFILLFTYVGDIMYI